MSESENSTGDLVSREEDCLLGFNGRIDWSRAANPGTGLCLLTLLQTCGHRRQEAPLIIICYFETMKIFSIDFNFDSQLSRKPYKLFHVTPGDNLQ